MDFYINSGNVLDLIDRAAAAASIAADPLWHDPTYRRTFSRYDVDRPVGALGWILATSGVHLTQQRETIVAMSEDDSDLPYHFWPSAWSNSRHLVEPDPRVLAALDAACLATPWTAPALARRAYVTADPMPPAAVALATTPTQHGELYTTSAPEQATGTPEQAVSTARTTTAAGVIELTQPTAPVEEFDPFETLLADALARLTPERQGMVLARAHRSRDGAHVATALAS